MPDLARIDQVCAAVVARITELWEPTAPDGVELLNDQDINTDPKQGAVTLGRKVFVIPAGDRPLEPATRGEDTYECEVRIWVAELYTGAGRPPLAWVQARRLWVSQVINDQLLQPRGPRILPDPADPDGLQSGLWVDDGQVDVATDFDELRGRNLFFSSALVKYRGHLPAAS